MFCSHCGLALRAGSKFCASCGVKVSVQESQSSYRLTRSEVFDWLREDGDDLDDNCFSFILDVGENRSQLTWVHVGESSDGEPGSGKVTIWSRYGTSDEVTLDEAVYVVEDSNFGMRQVGSMYVIHTIAHIEDFNSLAGLARLVLWVALAADRCEERLLGTDEY